MEKEAEVVEGSQASLVDSFLTDDALLCILLHCDALTLVRCSLVCKRLQERVTQVPELVFAVDFIRPIKLRLVADQLGSKSLADRLRVIHANQIPNTPQYNSQQSYQLKCVFVGDPKSGKTTFLIALTTNKVLSEYIPTVFDNYSQKFILNGNIFEVGLWDTAGQEDYDRLRPLSYPQTDIFFLCFDVSSKEQFETIKTKWHPEVSQHNPDTPTVLVGLKRELRVSPLVNKDTLVSCFDAYTLADEIGCCAYMECSSVTGDGLECFEVILERILHSSPFVDDHSTLIFGRPLADTSGKFNEDLQRNNTKKKVSKAPSVTVSRPQPRPTYDNEMETLRSMGFEDEDAMRAALERASGNVDHACAILFAD